MLSLPISDAKSYWGLQETDFPSFTKMICNNISVLFYFCRGLLTDFKREETNGLEELRKKNAKMQDIMEKVVTNKLPLGL